DLRLLSRETPHSLTLEKRVKKGSHCPSTGPKCRRRIELPDHNNQDESGIKPPAQLGACSLKMGRAGCGRHADQLRHAAQLRGLTLSKKW
ncbi:MAG: hypothetical protein M3536_02650, partial [Actinomycetota bacterium]|nr:hypothetical protein [Actinomycetota bacterium]